MACESASSWNFCKLITRFFRVCSSSFSSSSSRLIFSLRLSSSSSSSSSSSYPSFKAYSINASPLFCTVPEPEQLGSSKIERTFRYLASFTSTSKKFFFATTTVFEHPYKSTVSRNLCARLWSFSNANTFPPRLYVLFFLSNNAAR